MESEKLQHLCKAKLRLKVGDREYSLSPLELRHWAEWELWARRQPFARLADKVNAVRKLKIDDELRKEQIANLIEKADQDSKDSDLMIGTMYSGEGQLYVLKLSLSVDQPKITDEEVDSILREYTVKDLTSMIEDISTTGEAKKAEAE